MNVIQQAGPAGAEKTMELLWTRIRQRGDLPGFSKVVSAIINAMRGEDDREFNMTKTVLQDPALTQKVLRLANSAMYSVFGQGINTVSKAVIVLGTEAIGHLALGLKLIDGLSSVSSDSANARAEMEQAVLAGHIARQVVSSAGTRDAEEAVVCSMLHSLGRMMVTFYLADRWQQVQARCAESGSDEKQVAHEIFGLGLDEIGREVAKQWGLPASLIHTLHDMPPRTVGEPLDHHDWLAAVSTLSSRCATVICRQEESAHAGLAALAGDYAEMLGIETSDVVAAVNVAQTTAAEEGAVLPRHLKRVALVSGKPVDAAAILTRGVADMRGVLDNASTSQLMSMALEIIYQGLAFSRVIAFVRDPDKEQYAAHMCLGEGVQELMPSLTFSDAYQPDVFHASLANDKMIFVENATDPAFVNKLPRWWKSALQEVRSFVVLPLSVNRRPVGFIYGDWDKSKPSARIEQAEILPLNELRKLVVHAMETQSRRQAEPAWTRKLL